MRQGLLPFRFVALVGQIALSIMLVSNRDLYVRQCIPWDYTSDQYWSKDIELVTGLSLSLVFLLFELLMFLSGITMLHVRQCFASLCLHSIGSLVLLALMLDCWSCSIFWWLFALTTVVPLLSELIIVIRSVLTDKSRS